MSEVPIRTDRRTKRKYPLSGGKEPPLYWGRTKSGQLIPMTRRLVLSGGLCAACGHQPNVHQGTRCPLCKIDCAYEFGV